MRCFVALLPGQESRPALAALLDRAAQGHPQARAVHPADLHLTLAFIGDLPETRARALAAALAQRPAPQAPPWQLDHLGAFQHARVLWAGGPHHPGLDALAAEVRTWLDAAGVAYDRKRFVPHVTLLRKLPPDAAADHAFPATIAPPIPWAVGAPMLMAASPNPGAPRYTSVAAATPRFGCDQADPNP